MPARRNLRADGGYARDVSLIHLKPVIMRKYIVIAYLLITYSMAATAQVAITTDGSAPDNSAILDLKSDNRGLLIPRMNKAQRENIPSPATGLLIFQTGSDPGLYYHDAGNWIKLITYNDSWGTFGNAGTSSAFNALGTTDSQPLRFIVNNIRSGEIAITSGNTSLGYQSGNGASTGTGNTFIGFSTGNDNTSGNTNTFLGYEAGSLNTGGSRNTFVGNAAGKANLSGNDNTFVGRDAGMANTATGNSFFGRGAGKANTLGIENCAFGRDAGSLNTTGNSNSYFGQSAGYGNTGSNNAFFGNKSGYGNGTGGANTFLGSEAGAQNSTGSGNTLVGAVAGYSNVTGSGNTLVGFAAAVGSGRLNNATALGNNAIVSASNAHILGSIAGVNGATQDVSVGIGTSDPDAKLEVKGATGVTTRLTSADGSNVNLDFKRQGSDWRISNSGGFLRFGQSSDDLVTVINVLQLGGGSVNPAADGTISLGSSSLRWQTVYSVNGVNQTSDLRMKREVKPLGPGLAPVLKLNPVTYRWKDASIDQGREHIGFIAQELMEVLPAAVQGQGWSADMEGTPKEWTETELLTVNYSEVIPVLVKAIQEQQQMITKLQERVKRLEGEAPGLLAE